MLTGGMEMETRSKEVPSRNQKSIVMNITPGHFATRNSHINYYIDLTNIKCMHQMARLAGRELAAHYAETPVNTIICLDGTETVAAFLAASLSDDDSKSMNHGSHIAVLTPEINISGQLMFRDNIQRMIWEQDILLLAASATTGATLSQAIECIAYYSGKINGICAIFSAVPEIGDIPVQSIFTMDDVSGYAAFLPADCPECRAKRKIDALVNSFGYSKL
jgi:orotate phosphoribosyltransferase